MIGNDFKEVLGEDDANHHRRENSIKRFKDPVAELLQVLHERHLFVFNH